MKKNCTDYKETTKHDKKEINKQATNARLSRLLHILHPLGIKVRHQCKYREQSSISYHVIMCIAFAFVFVSCIRAFSPLSVSQSDTLTCTGAPLLSSFRVRVLNVLGMSRTLPSGRGVAPVDHLSSFGSFGARLVLQRLSAYPQRPLLSCSPTPLQNSPITHLNHLHVLRRWITIVWAKTTPHLDAPSSLYQ